MTPTDDEGPAVTHMTLRLPPGLDAELSETAKRLERSKAWVVRRAIRKYVDDLAKAAKPVAAPEQKTVEPRMKP